MRFSNSYIREGGCSLKKVWYSRLAGYIKDVRYFIKEITYFTKTLIGRGRRYIWRPRLPTTGAINLNLGCGLTDHPEFINIDGFPYPHVHFVHRIDRLPMFKDESIDMVYASHCLEHFKYRDIAIVLAEWARVIKIDGILQLSVPDFDRLVRIYELTGDPDDIVEQMMGGQDTRHNYHYSVFNKKSLTKHLLNAGFKEVTEWEPGPHNFASFNDFSSYRKKIEGNEYEISLNLIARK